MKAITSVVRDVGHQAANGVGDTLRMATLGKMRGIVPRRYSTSTLIDSMTRNALAPARPETSPTIPHSRQRQRLSAEIDQSSFSRAGIANRVVSVWAQCAYTVARPGRATRRVGASRAPSSAGGSVPESDNRSQATSRNAPFRRPVRGLLEIRLLSMRPRIGLLMRKTASSATFGLGCSRSPLRCAMTRAHCLATSHRASSSP